MFLKSSFALLLLCGLGLNAAFAQDPTKVEPKHYRLAFENEQVKVLYIHYGPHEKSALHEHPAGVVVNISNGHLKFADQHGNVQEVRALRGEARWFPALKHTVENLSAEPYEGVFIGMKKNGAGSASNAARPLPGDEQANRRLAAEVLRELALSAATCVPRTAAEPGHQPDCFNGAAVIGSEKLANNAR